MQQTTVLIAKPRVHADWDYLRLFGHEIYLRLCRKAYVLHTTGTLCRPCLHSMWVFTMFHVKFGSWMVQSILEARFTCPGCVTDQERTLYATIAYAFWGCAHPFLTICIIWGQTCIIAVMPHASWCRLQLAALYTRCVQSVKWSQTLYWRPSLIKCMRTLNERCLE